MWFWRQSLTVAPADCVPRSRLSFMATMADMPAALVSRHSGDRGGLWEGAVWQSCVVEAPALSIMEQLFGVLCARVLERRVNRGEEQCKQRWDGGSWFPATVKGGKHPRELDSGVVDTGLHKQHYTERCGKEVGAYCERRKQQRSIPALAPIQHLTYIFILMEQVIPGENIWIILDTNQISNLIDKFNTRGFITLISCLRSQLISTDLLDLVIVVFTHCIDLLNISWVNTVWVSS